MRYADPELCPDCRTPLPKGAPVCGHCDLLVRHPLAVDLFRTLTTADSLVADLREASIAFHGRATTPLAPVTTVPPAATVPPIVAPGAPLPAPEPTLPTPTPPTPTPPPGPATTYPAPVAAPAAHSGVAFASVPKILLGTGAFCLLVAAATFLAVSWSTLGVGGRTAVLLGLTLSSGVGALLLHRIGLRIAGESLIVVALGMLALDVFGAGAAGWIGDGTADSEGLVTMIAGLVVCLAGVLLGLVRMGSEPRLVAPQIISGIGLLTGYLGSGPAFEHPMVLGHVFTAAAVLTVFLTRDRGLPALLWSHAIAGSIAWLVAAAFGLVHVVDQPTLHELWVEGAGWSLLVTAAALLVPGLAARHHPTLLAGASLAAMVVTGILTVPCLDAGTTTFTVVTLGTTAVWLTALGVLPKTFRAVAVAPSATGSLILLGIALTTTAVALSRWGTGTEVFGQDAGLRIDGSAPVTEPLLTVPALMLPLVFVALLVPSRSRSTMTTWAQLGATTVGVGAAITLASYDIALAAPLAVLVVTALGATAVALTSTDTRTVGFTAIALLLVTAATVGALPSEMLTLVVAAVGAGLGAALAYVGRDQASRTLGGIALAPLLAAAVAGLVFVVDGDTAWVAVPVLLACGLVAIIVPRAEIELSAAATGLIVWPFSMEAAGDPGGLAALWLTVAGFLACSSALLHESRRLLAWAGGGLLVLAMWVRLADLAVREPEAYTLPLAVGLLGAGWWRMKRSAQAGSTESLLPGLLLATIPSLLWVLGDPVSLRALILGAGCLVLAVTGAALRWSAPLVVGASVGTIIVFRELGAYPGDIPKWVWIGLAGALLTIVGITWERKLLDLRKAVGYLGRLR